MKVIFLDFDGVLNSHQWFQALYRETKKGGLVREFCPLATANLLYILSEVPDAKIVVSSSWRIGTELDELRRILKVNAEVPEDRVIDKTPVSREASRERGHEIQEWLTAHPEVTKFVIIDDSDDMAHLAPYLVHTSWDMGLMMDKAREVVRRLEPTSACGDCGAILNHAHGGRCQPCVSAALRQERASNCDDTALNNLRSEK